MVYLVRFEQCTIDEWSTKEKKVGLHLHRSSNVGCRKSKGIWFIMSTVDSRQTALNVKYFPFYVLISAKVLHFPPICIESWIRKKKNSKYYRRTIEKWYKEHRQLIPKQKIQNVNWGIPDEKRKKMVYKMKMVHNISVHILLYVNSIFMLLEFILMMAMKSIIVMLKINKLKNENDCINYIVTSWHNFYSCNNNNNNNGS